MIISPRVAVLILSQPHETTVLELTLDHVLQGTEGDVAVIALMNGGGAGRPRQIHGHDPRLTLLESPRNLGVAGGRSLLLNHPMAREAEVVVFLDNDVMTPVGLIEALADRVIDDPHIGVVGPAILNIQTSEDRLTDRLSPVVMDTLLSWYSKVDSRSFFHLGTNPNWRATYLEERGLGAEILRMAGYPAEFHSMLHNDPMVIGRLRRGDLKEISAANVAGACQAFRRSLVDEVGPPDPIFSPYGYEDVDFCVRVREAGYRVAVHPDLVMLHGTDDRHQRRRTWLARRQVLRNMHRCKTLFAYAHAGPDWLQNAEDFALRRFVINQHHLGFERARDLFSDAFGGIRDAIRQLRSRHGSDVIQPRLTSK